MAVFSLSTRSSQPKRLKIVSSKAIRFEQWTAAGWANVDEGGLWLFRISFWQHLSSDHVYSPEKGAAVHMKQKI